MHYKNGRLAAAGQTVLAVNHAGRAIVGIVSETHGGETCNIIVRNPEPIADGGIACNAKDSVLLEDALGAVKLLARPPINVAPVVPKFSYSTDEERFYGEYPTAEEAARAAFVESDELQLVYVGESVPPPGPETYLRVEDILERPQDMDEENYGGEWNSWEPADISDAQKEELEEALQLVMAAWLDRHDLRPTHFSIPDSRKFTREEIMGESQPGTPAPSADASAPVEGQGGGL